MAHELGISLKLWEAAELILTSHKRRTIDLAKIGDQVFMLRAYVGLSAEDAASRDEKDKYGQLAYIQAAINFLRYVPETHYKVTVDSEVVEGEALICFILNAGSIGGVMGISLPTIGTVDISDGLLDLYVITKGLQPIWAVSEHFFDYKGADTGVYHWRAKEISIESDPIQDVWIDGELGGITPFTVSAMPQALEIVVPA